jgi:hypothetical protein
MHFINEFQILIVFLSSPVSVLLSSTLRFVQTEGYKRVHPTIASVFLYHLSGE